MSQFLIHFCADAASAVCWGEIQARLASAGLDASAILPRESSDVLQDPCVVVEFPSSDVGHRVCSGLFTARTYYELLANAPTLDAAVSALATLPPSSLELFNVSAFE